MYTGLLISGPFFYKILLDTLEETGDVKKLFLIIGLWIVVILSTVIARYSFGMIVTKELTDDWHHFSMKAMNMMLKLPIDYHISIEH